MSRLSFISDDAYPGEGVSVGIPRGLLVRRGETDLVQEGLGLGTVALRRRGVTYFPSSSVTAVEGSRITKEFTVDSALVLESPLLPLSRMMPLYGLGTRAYMTFPRWQERVLGLRSALFSRLKVRPRLRRTSPLAAARFTYSPRPDGVDIKAVVRSLDGALGEVFMMNELGADHFDSAIRDGRVVPAPTGWCPLPHRTPTPALMDTEHGTTFFIDRLRHGGTAARLYWGREKNEDLCWAGFELELRGLGKTMDVEYDLRFGEVRV